MSNTIRLYTRAVRLHQVGRKDDAAHVLSWAMGSRKTLPVVKNSIDSLLSENSKAMQVTETLIRGKMK